jgi:hypothetical protein
LCGGRQTSFLRNTAGDWIGGEIGFGMTVLHEVEYEIYSNKEYMIYAYA